MYKQAREYLEGIAGYGSILGLERMKELLKRLGNPQESLSFIHIAGTNGKGSSVTFVSTILREAGYKTGRYTSPAVFSYREKIQINGENITKDAFAKYTFQIKETIQEMLQAGYESPTIFEVETALAFIYFKEELCDIVVLETGLGGRLDATNVVTNTLVAGICAISMDHMEFLGDTLEEITRNKIGIIKPCSSVVTTNQVPQVMNVIETQCKKTKHDVMIADSSQAQHISYDAFAISFDYGEFKNLKLQLSGSYQIQNAILAVEIIKALKTKGFVIEEKAIIDGLQKTTWGARFSRICNHPIIMIDGAHNEAATRQLRQTIQEHFPEKKVLLVMGVFADKEYEKMLQIMAPVAQKILTITIPNNPRALAGERLAKVAEKYHQNIEYIPSLEMVASVCMKQKESDVVVAFGSLSYLAEFEKQIKSLQK